MSERRAPKQGILPMEGSMVSKDNSNNFSQNATANASDVWGAQGCCEPGAEHIVVPVIFSVVIFGGCVGNTFVIVVLVKNRRNIRNTTGILMFNLAVADMLFLLFCIPFHAVIYTISHWPFGDFMCRFVHFMQFSSMFASVFTLVAMAVDRYTAIKFPIRTKLIRNPGIASIISVVIWVLSLCLGLPAPIVYTVKTYMNYGSEPLDICADSWGEQKSYRPTFFLMLFLIGYVLPLVTIFVLSVLSVSSLWRTSNPERTNVVESIRCKRKATKLVIGLVTAFGITWLPYHLSCIWANYFDTTFFNNYAFYYFHVFSMLLSYTNSALNPLVYAFLSENFRKRLCHCSNTDHSGIAIAPSRRPLKTQRFREIHPRRMPAVRDRNREMYA